MATKFLRHSDELYHSFKQQTTEGGELCHYGRKGMKWGKHIYGFAGGGPESLLLERAGKAYRGKKDREERAREERESQLKYNDGRVWTQDKKALAEGRRKREAAKRQARIDLGVSAGKYVAKKATGRDVDEDIDNVTSRTNRVKAGHARYNTQQNSKNEQAGMNKMYAEQDRQREQRKREELVKSANRNVKEKRYNEKIGMNKVREEQARQKQLREEQRARAASSARRNADLNAHNARLGMEKARAEQERQRIAELAKHARANSYANKMNAKSGMEKAHAEQERQARRPRAVQELRNKIEQETRDRTYDRFRYATTMGEETSDLGRRVSGYERKKNRVRKARNTAAKQAEAERRGRESALAEQERQARERRNRKRPTR